MRRFRGRGFIGFPDVGAIMPALSCRSKAMDIRTLTLGIGAFCATFLVGWWFNIGGLAAGFAKPGPASAASDTAGRLAAAQPKPQGKGLVNDKPTRDAVIAWARRYQNPSCNQDARWGYVRAATKYAEALMRSAGCHNFPRCPMSMGQLDRVWQANRSPLDTPVAEAMAEAAGAGGLNEKSFRGDVGRAVRVIAGRGFDPGPPPDCSTRRNRSWSFRIRGRR
jgi:hypothetical protein